MKYNSQTKAEVLKALKSNKNFEIFMQIVEEEEVNKLEQMLMVKDYKDIHEFNRDRDSMNISKKFITIIDSYIKRFEIEEETPRKNYEVYELPNQE